MFRGTLHNGTVQQFNLKEFIRISFNANILCGGNHILMPLGIIGLHLDELCFLIHKLFERYRGIIGAADTGITGEAAGGTQDQAVGVFKLLPVNHDKVVGKCIDTVVQCLSAGLEQLLGGERDEDRHTGGSKTTLDLNLIQSQGQAADHSFLLLIVQCSDVAVVLLGDGVGLEDVVVKLPLAVSGVQNEECHKEHSLVSALEVCQ